MISITPDPNLDLVFEKTVDVPAARIWAAWTTPELLVQWFTPAPWKTTEADLDLRPGGHFTTVMVSPDGEQFPNTGCFLEIIPNRRLVFTNALAPGFRPTPLPPTSTDSSSPPWSNWKKPPPVPSTKQQQSTPTKKPATHTPPWASNKAGAQPWIN